MKRRKLLEKYKPTPLKISTIDNEIARKLMNGML